VESTANAGIREQLIDLIQKLYRKSSSVITVDKGHLWWMSAKGDSNVDNCRWRGWVKDRAHIRKLVFLVSLFQYVLQMYHIMDNA